MISLNDSQIIILCINRPIEKKTTFSFNPNQLILITNMTSNPRIFYNYCEGCRLSCGTKNGTGKPQCGINTLNGLLKTSCKDHKEGCCCFGYSMDIDRTYNDTTLDTYENQSWNMRKQLDKIIQTHQNSCKHCKTQKLIQLQSIKYDEEVQGEEILIKPKSTTDFQDEYRQKCLDIIYSDEYAEKEVNINPDSKEDQAIVSKILGKKNCKSFMKVVYLFNNYSQDEKEFPKFSEYPFKIIVAFAHLLIFENRIENITNQLYKEWGNTEKVFDYRNSWFYTSIQFRECHNWIHEDMNADYDEYDEKVGRRWDGIYEITANNESIPDSFQEFKIESMSYTNKYNFDIDSNNSIYTIRDMNNY